MFDEKAPELIAMAEEKLEDLAAEYNLTDSYHSLRATLLAEGGAAVDGNETATSTALRSTDPGAEIGLQLRQLGSAIKSMDAGGAAAAGQAVFEQLPLLLGGEAFAEYMEKAQEIGVQIAQHAATGGQVRPSRILGPNGLQPRVPGRGGQRSHADAPP